MGTDTYGDCLKHRKAYEEDVKKDYMPGNFVVCLKDSERVIKGEIYGVVLGVGKEFDYETEESKKRTHVLIRFPDGERSLSVKNSFIRPAESYENNSISEILVKQGVIDKNFARKMKELKLKKSFQKMVKYYGEGDLIIGYNMPLTKYQQRFIGVVLGVGKDFNFDPGMYPKTWNAEEYVLARLEGGEQISFPRDFQWIGPAKKVEYKDLETRLKRSGVID